MVLHRLGEIDEIGLARDGGFGNFLRFFFLQTFDAEQFGLLIGAAGDFYKIDPAILQPARHLKAFLEIETAALEIGTVEFDRDRKIGADELPHGVDDEQ